jgi:hypothetical protein
MMWIVAYTCCEYQLIQAISWSLHRLWISVDIEWELQLTHAMNIKWYRLWVVAYTSCKYNLIHAVSCSLHMMQISTDIGCELQHTHVANISWYRLRVATYISTVISIQKRHKFITKAHKFFHSAGIQHTYLSTSLWVCYKLHSLV